MKRKEKETYLTNRKTRELFPTADSPKRTNLNWNTLLAAAAIDSTNKLVCCVVLSFFLFQEALGEKMKKRGKTQTIL